MTSESTRQTQESLKLRIQALRQSLRYWQTWEAEYEGFAEELQAESKEPSAERMIGMAAEYGSSVVDQTEMRKMVSMDKRPVRTRKQILDLIRGRVQTGCDNAQAILKQITAAEHEMQQFDDQKTGLDPIMEVTELLSDQGDVLSSKLENYEDAVERVQKALQTRSLLDDKPADNCASKPQQSIGTVLASSPPHVPSHSRPTTDPATDVAADQESQIASKPATETKSSIKASAIAHPTPPDPHLAEPDLDTEQDEEAEALEELNQLRQSLDVVGPIVANLDLEEENEMEEEEDFGEDFYHDGLDDDDDDDDNYDNDDDDDDDENDYGMSSIKSEITQDYIREMQALARKHRAPMPSHLEPASSPTPSPIPSAAAAAAAGVAASISHSILRRPNRSGSTKPTASKPPKSVKFARDLDIASTASSPAKPAMPPTDHTNPATTAHATMTDQIVERPIARRQPVAPVNTAAKTSRFKAHTAAAAAASAASAASDRHVPDPTSLTMQQEFALYKQTSALPLDRSIFEHDQDSLHAADLVDLPTPISRFKAARLGISLVDES